MNECRHCKYSIASLVDYKLILMCLFWRRAAKEPCPEFEREPCVDDDQTSPHPAMDLVRFSLAKKTGLVGVDER